MCARTLHLAVQCMHINNTWKMFQNKKIKIQNIIDCNVFFCGFLGGFLFIISHKVGWLWTFVACFYCQVVFNMLFIESLYLLYYFDRPTPHNCGTSIKIHWSIFLHYFLLQLNSIFENRSYIYYKVSALIFRIWYNICLPPFK